MIVRVIHRVVDLGWVALGSTLIWVFHHLAHPASLSCQTPISPGRIWQTVEHSKLKSTQPSPREDESPCIVGKNIFSRFGWLSMHVTLRSVTHHDAAPCCCCCF